jgi:hypothetical protein
MILGYDHYNATAMKHTERSDQAVGGAAQAPRARVFSPAGSSAGKSAEAAASN